MTCQKPLKPKALCQISDVSLATFYVFDKEIVDRI